MVDFQQDGELLGRIRSIRKIRAGYGFLPPVVHIRDNMDLQPARYRIFDEGVEIGGGTLSGRWLAINPGTAAGTLPGEKPSVIQLLALMPSGLRSYERRAQIRGFTVVEASTVAARPTLDWPILPPNCLAAGKRSNCWIVSLRRCLNSRKMRGPRRRDPHDFTQRSCHTGGKSPDSRYAHHSGNAGGT